MRWATGLHDLSKVKDDKSKDHISQPLLSVVRPEKMQFAFTYDTKSDDNVHALQPFVGV
jgi:hypothetical protein